MEISTTMRGTKPRTGPCRGCEAFGPQRAAGKSRSPSPGDWQDWTQSRSALCQRRGNLSSRVARRKSALNCGTTRLLAILRTLLPHSAWVMFALIRDNAALVRRDSVRLGGQLQARERLLRTSDVAALICTQLRGTNCSRRCSQSFAAVARVRSRLPAINRLITLWLTPVTKKRSA